ncbi:hypothetical protein KR093_006440, partial [Drosophila rubida]
SIMAAAVDLNLLRFKKYDDYLNSFIKCEDYRYISNLSSIKKFVKLGYRCTRNVYEEPEFYEMKIRAAEFLNPKLSTFLYGNYFKGTDEALEALREREPFNIKHIISTIIFVQLRQRSGFDISGYIDFEQSLRECTARKADRTNWKSVFEGKTLLRPKRTDLSYYDWHLGQVCHNNTDNYVTVVGGVNLTFMHKEDHKHIPVTDKHSKYSMNVARVMIPSELYGHIVIYDHIIR